ncbi:MAG: ATP-binding protein, partial [Microcoleus sp. SIO2G3]|nr:ATP-binding protein [Microcoleus sp. SIO2G3]
MDAASKRNDSSVSVTPALRRKLRSAFDQRFKSTEDFLNQWGQQADTLGEPPCQADVQNILYSVTRGICVYWVINGVCQLLLDRPYRDNSTKQVPLALKQQLRDKFNERFKVRGEISWGEFSVAWVEQLDDCDPPRHQTIRSFLESEHRNSCEHWLVNGLCQMLLNCSFGEWLEQELRTRDKEDKGDKEPNFSTLSSQSKIQNPKSTDDGATRWVGRAELITQLSCRLQADCRVLSIVGITGIGKTALAMRLILEPEVNLSDRELYTVSLDHDSPNFEVLARRLLGQVATDEQLQKDPDLLVRAMVAKLQSHPCLLVLDMVEEILEPDGKGGHQFIESGFAKLLEQVVKTEQCNSRIILTSQDRPPIIAEGRYFEQSHLERLRGLEESEAIE